MNTKITSVFIGMFALQLLTTPAMADWKNKDRSWYLGAGLGLTELDPDTNNTGYSVTDDKDSGFKLFGGYDFTERLTLEGFYADLGSAQIGSSFPTLPDGTIDYSIFGASALWYFVRNGENKGENLRKGLQIYAHAGLSSLNNSANVNYSQSNSVQIQYGAGVEYGFNDGIAVRAGLDLYDKDASLVFVSVMKRFGVKPRSKKIIEPKPVVEPVVEKPVEIVPTQKVVIPVAVVTYDIDTDSDGIVDRLDHCADSPSEFSVDKKGCSIIELNFGGVNFEPRSFDLTEESKTLLDEVVITINASPELQKIEVQAHTDYKGSGEANLKLSEKRAESVKAYLVSQGVVEKRLVAKGYGESQPIADNKTEEGRAKNRRVELKVIKDEVVEIE